MNHSARIIVLHCTKTGEKSLVMHCYSREWGRRSFIVSAARAGSFALFAPLNILEAEIVVNPKSDLWRAHAFSVVNPLNGIRMDVRKNTVALFISEVLYRTLKDSDADDGLFEYLQKSILLLDSMEEGWSNFHLRWLLDYCSVLGFSPCAEDMAPFAGEQMSNIAKLLETPFAQSMMVPLTGADRSLIAEAILLYISCHFEYQINVRSLKILRELSI